MELKDFQRYCGASYIFTNLIIAFLIAIGAILISVDLAYMTDWVNGYRLADFYTYLTLMGVISAWSVFGLVCSIISSLKGLNIYIIGLIVLVVIQLIVGCVHIVMLFSTYLPILMNTCLQRDSSRYFWWSLGYEETAEMKEILGKCNALWKSFSTERLVSWIVYSLITFVSLYFIIRHQRKLNREYKLARGMLIEEQKDDWSSEHHVDEDSKDADNGVVTYHDEEFPATDDSVSASMHQQRQKLYEEITKRKRAKKNLNRKSIAQNPNRSSILVVHPLDLSRDPESYEPPAMPSPPEKDEKVNEEKSWNRYESTIDEDEKDIEREKKLKALSSERMDYEAYCSNEPNDEKKPLVTDDNEQDEKHVSHRKRPQSGRWSAVYPEHVNPLAAIQQNETPESEDDEEKQHLMRTEH